MELNELKNLVRELAIVEETPEPFVSCYLNLTDSNWKNFMQSQFQLIKKALPKNQRESFELSAVQIEEYLENHLLDSSQGICLFVRNGQGSYFQALQFLVPTENWIGVDTLPSIYHLIEMKDTYHRFVIVLSSKDSARILEVNLGAVTESLWTEKPELRERVGREWTKLHYQNHLRDRTRKYFKEKVSILEKLMAQAGHPYLILAGVPETMNHFHEQLPKHLKNKVVDLVQVSDKQQLPVIISKTLASFIEKEKEESFSAVEKLQQTIAQGGLAVCGEFASLAALENWQADMLVIDQDFIDEAAREKMIRIATQSGCQVETVSGSELLKGLGGVGCFLRYFLPEQIQSQQKSLKT